MPERERESSVELERLRIRRDFQAAAKGRRKHCRWFTLQAAAAAGRDGLAPRIGLTVTRKVGTATERNRMRRRLREALRAMAPRPGRAGHDYVIVAKRDSLYADFLRLSEELRGAFETVHADRRPDAVKGAHRRIEGLAARTDLAPQRAQTSDQASRS